MAASTIPAAQAYLLGVIQARPGLTGVHVAWGIPADLPSDLERIYVGDPIEVSREWAGLGGQRMDENYTLQVHVETFAGGNEQQATGERFYTMVNEVEQAVRADNRLGGLVFAAKPNGVADPKTLPTDDGWMAGGTLRIAVEARI